MSQIPVTEVCIIDLKAPYDLKDPSTPEGAIWASSISTLKKCPGFRDIYTSSVVEDRGKAHWDSKADHLSFYDTPHFPAFRAQLLSLCAVPPIPIHVLFHPAQPKTLQAPVTEVVMAYFPLAITTEQKEKWESIWQGFVTKVGGEVEGVRDVHGGWVVEGMEVEGLEGEMRAWMGTVGWEGWGAQKGKAGEGLVGVLDGAEGLVKREIYHVELT
ncbi:hypothetical protein HO133_007359 [Letharia lupina]|uniref:Uncharacterized protein n=1 Tax=Letharia lupina TaxID=560253 RepID=A0A8H6KYM8_9LECA|nr:uncharacterized protein HO133_007359 [Letharia lupina]KAF6229243.1 hypothetical protein HO133_007359 [Letharia lupina]